MKTFNLNPINNRKSFNNKCHVNKFFNNKNEEISVLISYNTEVAEYNHTNNKMIVKNWFSSTTASHINSFLSFYNFKTCTKKELQNYNN